MTPPVVAHSVDKRPAVYVAGDLYTVLASGKETGGAYATFDAIIPPGGGPPPHIHSREDEAFYILEGEITFYAGGIKQVAPPGTWVHAYRDHAHRFKNETDKPARMLIMVFPAGIEDYFLQVGQPVVDRLAPVPHPTPADIEKLIADAPQCGIEILM